jgi:hypothetical protein
MAAESKPSIAMETTTATLSERDTR